MKRRSVLAAACGVATSRAALAVAPRTPDLAHWMPPERFVRPDAASDEGGLWALMDREESRLRRSPFVIRDAGLQSYLQEVACKLAGDHCPSLRFYAVRTPFFNASMAPNGMVQVWSGLLLRVDNEAQLAAVLGHEMAHYLQRHTLDQLHDAESRSAFQTFMSAFGVIGALGILVTAAGAFSFSRDQERQADAIGLMLMRQAGYDPREASKVWTNLQSELAAGPDGDPTKGSPLFATHPPSEERRQTLARLADNDSGGLVGESAYAVRLAPFQMDLLEDEVKRGQPGQSIALFDRLLQRSPQRADVHYFRGETRRLRAQNDDLTLALADFERAVAIGDEPPQTYRSIGYLQQRLDHGPEAQTAFGRYLERAPDAPDAHLIQHYLSESKT